MRSARFGAGKSEDAVASFANFIGTLTANTKRAAMNTFSSKTLMIAAFALATSSSIVNAASCHPDSCTVAVRQLLCGSDGVTYRSICELELAQCSRSELKIASVGACGSSEDAVAKCDEQDVCGDSSYPICGSDGVTYQNACYFDRAYCKNTALIPMGYGACEATTTTPSLRS